MINRKRRKISFISVCLLLSLIMALPPGFAPAIAGEESGDSNQKAYVKHPRESSVSLQESRHPGSYGWAKEQLFNGTEVVITDIYAPWDDLPPGTPQDLSGEWAAVTVGSNDLFEGSMGYVPLSFLALEDDYVIGSDSKIVGAVQSEAENSVRLLADTGLSDKSMSSYPVGKQVRVLGQTLKYYHVEADGMVGFLPISALGFDEHTAQIIEAAQPTQFLEVQPGWEEHYEEYNAKLMQMYDEYGDPGQWTLTQAAEGSALSQQYGFTWIEDKFFILPDSSDIDELSAVEKARIIALDQFGVNESDIVRVSGSFYYPPQTPEARTWSVRFYVKAPGHDVMIFLDSNGELVKTWKDSQANRHGAPPEVSLEEIKAVFEKKPVMLAEDFIKSIIDLTWFDFDISWYPSIKQTTIDEIGSDSVWLVTYTNQSISGEMKVVVSLDEKILAWALPGQGYTNIMPDDIDTLLSEAQIFKPAQYGPEADVMRLAGAVLQDRLNLSCEQAALYRQEPYLIRHPKYADGNAPVWLVMHYDDQNELAFKTLYTNGAELIAFALPGIEFTDTTR